MLAPNSRKKFGKQSKFRRKDAHALKNSSGIHRVLVIMGTRGAYPCAAIVACGRSSRHTKVGRLFMKLRVGLILTMMVLVGILLSGVVLAVTKHCNHNCRGTGGDDYLTGSGSNNTLSGLGGADTVKGVGGTDLLFGDPGGDGLSGGPS